MVLASTLLLVLFVAYCYLPYLLGRSLVSFVEQVRPLRSSQFEEFVIASIPGVAFNATAYFVGRRLFPKYIRPPDWELLSGIFGTGAEASTQLQRWIRRGDLRDPAAYLFMVLTVAAVWSTLTAWWMRRIERGVRVTRARTKPDIKVVVRLTYLLAELALLPVGILAMLPLVPYFDQRYQRKPWSLQRIVVVLTKENIVAGRAYMFEFDGSIFRGVTVTHARTISARAVFEKYLAEWSDTLLRKDSFALYIPADEIRRLISVTPRFGVDTDVDSIATLLGLTNNGVESKQS